MSGIAAIIRFDDGKVEPGAIERMTQAIAYRGPDGIAHWRKGGVALGHLMLRTTAESLEEVQPLANEDESLVLVMDGWLSNWEELRADLLARGARLRTRSDAELVLRAYEVWGEECPRHIDGEFAFLVWDARRREAFCARDHAGLRPLHYHWDGRRLVVASDIAGVLAGPDVKRVPNKGMMAEIMANRWYTRDETIWQGVLRPLPAHWTFFGPEGMRSMRYWMPPLEVSINYKTDEEYFEHYRELFADSVRRASRTHRPLGCDVSGGLDSSAIFVMAHHLQKTGRLPAPSVNGYTLLFGGNNDVAGDLPYARAVGEFVGSPICEALELFPDLKWFVERGRADCDVAPYPNGAMAVGLGKAAVGDGCRVLLNGEGGDQWLHGNFWNYAEHLENLEWRSLYKTLREDIDELGFPRTIFLLFRFGFVRFIPNNLMDIIKWATNFVSIKKNNDPYWLSNELREVLEFRRKIMGRRSSSSISNKARREFSRLLNDPYVEIGFDRQSRQCAQLGFDPRTPMYARAYIEFAFATPERIRRRGGLGKYIHRKALSDLLPEVVLNRQSKAEFRFVFTRHLDEIQALLSSDLPQEAEDLLDREGVTRLHDRYRSGTFPGNATWNLWGIFACVNALCLEPTHGDSQM